MAIQANQGKVKSMDIDSGVIKSTSKNVTQLYHWHALAFVGGVIKYNGGLIGRSGHGKRDVCSMDSDKWDEDFGCEV